MKILLAPDKFKGSLGASEFCSIVEDSMQSSKSGLNIRKLPLADGGEGSLDALKDALGLSQYSVNVQNPLGKSIVASYAYDHDSAYIEMARASGLILLNENERNGILTSSFGTGQLISQAIEKNFKSIFLFVGGSATNDAGIGMASALGYKFYDRNDRILDPIATNLINFHYFTSPFKSGFKFPRVFVATDVNNPLCGPDGATFVYGPQKGISDQQIEQLEMGMINFKDRIKILTGIDLQERPGSGAAGGMGAGAVVFLNAIIKSGFETISEIVDLESHIKWADLIITGEGRLDEQTLSGKVVSGVSRLTFQNRKILVIVCGEVSANLTTEQIDSFNARKIYPIKSANISTQQAIENSQSLLKSISKDIINHLTIN